MRIAYLAGPADVLQSHRQWRDGGAQSYCGTDYMKQFFQLAQDVDADCYVISWFGQERFTKTVGRLTFDNRPLSHKKGAAFYLHQLWWHLKLWPALLRFRPDLLILTGNLTFWWILSLCPGARVLLPSFHSLLWPKFGPVSRAWRSLLVFEKFLVLRRCKIAVATSHDIGRQLHRMTDAQVIYHLPTYSPQQFDGVDPPSWSSPFRVIFVSRIAVKKGAFDVLEMARRLPDIQFDICGTGNALEAARAAAPANVMFHGFCDQLKMRELMSRAHAALVATHSELGAGFEMTCAEAILYGRPLVASAVCPALEYLRPASIEARPDDVDSYVDAISRLASDRDLYERKCAACEPLKAQFFDNRNSWLTAMKTALARLGGPVITSAPAAAAHPPFAEASNNGH